ncbi:MAG: HesA/MoeB/ThiF family protein [Muribaculaceae bacterium]|nr:HesA/MoeB/ThiF family protein [Muribaculaceae bacterium]
MDNQRYARQMMLEEIGEEGQRRISDASVLIVGVGGLGSIVATYLNGAGIGRIGLIDADTVSLTNLHRQVLYTEAQLGLPKAVCATEFLAARSNHTRIECHNEFLSQDNAGQIFKNYDLVVDCTDNFPTRFLINDTCAQLHKSWIFGAIGPFSGQVTVFVHGSGRSLADLYEREYLCSQPRTVAGVVGPVPGIIASIEALEAIKLIAGVPSPLTSRLFSIDLLTFDTHLLEF